MLLTRHLIMKPILLLILTTLFLIGCGRATPTPSPLPHSIKGYELYSWQAEGHWHFTLITGTNRNKTAEEITSSEEALTPEGWVKLTVLGAEGLPQLLGRLPKGEEIFWMGGPRTVPEGDFALPPVEIRTAVQETCQKLGLNLSIP